MIDLYMMMIEDAGDWVHAEVTASQKRVRDLLGKEAHIVDAELPAVGEIKMYKYKNSLDGRAVADTKVVVACMLYLDGDPDQPEHLDWRAIEGKDRVMSNGVGYSHGRLPDVLARPKLVELCQHQEGVIATYNHAINTLQQERVAGWVDSAYDLVAKSLGFETVEELTAFVTKAKCDHPSVDGQADGHWICSVCGESVDFDYTVLLEGMASEAMEQ